MSSFISTPPPPIVGLIGYLGRCWFGGILGRWWVERNKNCEPLPSHPSLYEDGSRYTSRLLTPCRMPWKTLNPSSLHFPSPHQDQTTYRSPTGEITEKKLDGEVRSGTPPGQWRPTLPRSPGTPLFIDPTLPSGGTWEAVQEGGQGRVPRRSFCSAPCRVGEAGLWSRRSAAAGASAQAPARRLPCRVLPAAALCLAPGSGTVTGTPGP